MSRITRQRLRKLERQGNKGALRKLIQTQELQIADLRARLAAAEMLIVMFAEGLDYDHIDPQTGEVTRARVLVTRETAVDTADRDT